MADFCVAAPCSLVETDRSFRDSASIIALMDPIRTSETSVSIYHTTWCNIKEDNHLHIRRLDKMKPHQLTVAAEPEDSAHLTKNPASRHDPGPISSVFHPHEPLP
jgi:hypothetical protein